MKRKWYEFHYKKNGKRRKLYRIRRLIWGIYLKRKYKGDYPKNIDIRDGVYSYKVNIKKLSKKYFHLEERENKDEKKEDS